MQVNPLTLIAGIIGTPIVGNTMGRVLMPPKDQPRTQAEADADLRRMMRNFAIFNGILATGLGYAATRKNLSENWRSVTLGGAISTGILAATLTAALVAGPQVEARAPGPPGTGKLLSAQRSWVSTFVPVSERAGYR